MLKKITALVLVIALSVMAAGCSDSGASQEEGNVSDDALHEQLMGSWVLLGDGNIEYDAEGNMVSFSVFEFTENKTKVHKVEVPNVYSWVVNEYSIKDGKYMVIKDGQSMYEGIRFTDEGNLELFIDATVDTFRRLTDEEQVEYAIPIGQSSIDEAMGSEE